MTEHSTTIPNPSIIVVRCFVWVGVIGRIIASLFGLAVLPKLYSTSSLPLRSLVTAFFLFIFWGIWHFRNWARQVFVGWYMVGIAFAIPVIPLAMIILKKISPQNVLMMEASGVLSLLFAAVFVIVLFRPNVRALFTTQAPNKWLRASLAILALLGFCAGSALQRIVRRYLQSTGLNSSTVIAPLQRDQNYPFIGFWKINCSDNYGVAIDKAANAQYSVSFCGPGGCFKPGTWTSNTPLIGDPRYRIIDQNTIQMMKTRKGDITINRCAETASEVLPPARENKAHEQGEAQSVYMKRVGSIINLHWKPPMQFTENTLCRVVFVVESDGSVSSVAIEKSSGGEEFDRISMMTIRNSVPFPPLPKDLGTTSLRIHLDFVGKIKP